MSGYLSQGFGGARQICSCFLV